MSDFVGDSAKTLEAALGLLRAGLAVLPINPERKFPPLESDEDESGLKKWKHGFGWKGFQTQLPRQAMVERFVQTFPGIWLGVACGEGSGFLEVADFDIPGKHELPKGAKGIAPAYEPWREMVIEHGLEDLLARLTIAETISGGIHCLWRCPGGIEGPLDLAKQSPEDGGEVLIETRGQGSLVVCWPTPGYRLLQGTMESIPTISKEERDILVGIATLLDERPQVEAKEIGAPRERAAGEEDRAGDEYEKKATWEEILEPHGWKFMRRSRGAMRFVVRPGKNAKEGHSARVGAGTRGDRMWVWSPNSSLPSQALLTKFAAYAFLNHGGDFAAAALALGKAGYGPQPKGKQKPIQTNPAPAQAGADSIRETAKPERSEEKPYWRTDLGNAQRFADQFGDLIRHCHDWERFLIWDGAKWDQDAPGNPAARVMAHRMVLEMSSSRDKETRAAGLKSQDSGKLSAILREAKAFPTIGVRSTQLDQHDFLLGAPNGVIDLNTGRLLDPNPDLLITQTVSVPYDPDAKCPEFDRFIQTIMKDRKQLADLLIRFLGYSLTGSTEAQKFVLLYGERGRNGKGTLIGTMRRLMGPGLCSIIDKKLLASSESDSARFARASLEGKRLVYANEASKNSKLDVEFVKEFTGTTDGMMMAERKGRDAYEFRNTAKLWYAVNVLPDVEWDGPYSARIVPIPFEQSFYNETESEWRHGDLPRDEGIERRLAEELPGILATLVQGALRWKQKGFNTPPEVAALKRQYKAQTDNVGAWIDECCAISPLAWTKSTDLFDSYAAFMKRSHRGRVGKNSEFYKRLEQVPGIVNQRPKNVSIWRGIELRDPANDPEPEEIRDQDGLQF